MLLAATYQPLAVGSIRDAGRDGTPDSFDAVFPGHASRTVTTENRAISEYSVGTETINLAVLDFGLGSMNAAGNQTRTFDVYVYGGDGQVTLSDYNSGGTLVRTVTLEIALLSDTYRLDVTDAVQQVAGAGNSFIGVALVSHTDTFPVSMGSPTLTTNGVIPMSGLRGWEPTRQAIRADGIETFRLEVDSGGAVNGVELDTWTADYRLFKPGTGRVALRDDGLEGDRIADDYIYTSGEFRFNTAYEMRPFYGYGPDSIAGIEVVSLGNVHIIELDGTDSQLLLDPEVGLVSPDISSVTPVQLSSDVQITPHFINVVTTKKATQSSMRQSRIRTSELSQQIYSVLPDAFDFLNYFSTNHLEVSPRLSSVNFTAGNHHTLKVDWTGSAWEPSDHSGGHGSAGRLLGVNSLDAMSRGINNTVTHELVHQWSAYLSSAFGISDSGGHYLNTSSAGSLVGGFEWIPNGDGSYTINFDEGRNGATHASPLELYMMGLIDKSQVPDILAYNPAVTPKSRDNPIVLPSEITRRVTIEDIIAVHGERTGPVRTEFRIGFAAESHGRFLTGTELAFYEQLSAHYTRDIPTDEADPVIRDGLASIDRFFGHGTTWTTLLPGQSEELNHAPVAQPGTFSVRSDAKVGNVVGTVIASDADAGQVLQYAIINSQNVFSINQSTGEIKVSNTFNLNQQTQYTLRVRVTDNGTPQQYDTVDVVIDVVPNRAPVLSPYTFAINENTLNGSSVGTILATDADVGQSLTYTVASSTLPGAFALYKYNGNTHATFVVLDGSLLNYESTPSVTLEVTVTDNGVPALSSTATVIINLNDVNESPVMLDQAFTVQENSANGVAVGTVVATDVDAGQSLTYSIFSGNTAGAFAINSATGQITVANSAALNFEGGTQQYLLHVTIYDNGTPQRFDSATITITVSDVNESPNVASQGFSVAENSANGTVVGTVVASDVDAGQSLSYAIASGNTSGAFAINAATGQITVANSAALNFEGGTQQYPLNVTVVDNGTPQRSASATITIAVSDVNESPNVASQGFSVAENSANGTVVGTIVASDVDAGQSLSYAIASGNTSGAFAINTSNGRIAVANSAAVDFETTPTFSLLVNVTDSGTPQLSTSRVVTVSLQDVAEAVSVAIDVVPGSSTNAFRRTAKFDVAILSSSTFDARLVSVASIRFGKLGTENSVVRDKKGKYVYSLRDVNGDGRLDLVVQIDGARTGLAVGDTLAKLTGALNSGISIFGSSTVKVNR